MKTEKSGWWRMRPAARGATTTRVRLRRNNVAEEAVLSLGGKKEPQSTESFELGER